MRDAESLHFLYKRKTFCHKYRKLLISFLSVSDGFADTPQLFHEHFLDLVENSSAAAEKFSNRAETLRALEHHRALAATLIPEFSLSPPLLF